MRVDDVVLLTSFTFTSTQNHREQLNESMNTKAALFSNVGYSILNHLLVL